MKLLMIVLIFFFFGAFFIVSQDNLALSSSANLDKFMAAYSSWLNHLLGNVGGVTGYLIKMDWLPGK